MIFQYVSLLEIPMTIQDLEELIFLAYRPCTCCGGLGYHSTDILDLGLVMIVIGSRPCNTCFNGLEFVNHLN